MDDFVWLVQFPGNGISARARDGDNLLDVMRAGGVDIAADCGGNGRCGKCVCFVDGERRLACETMVNSDIEVTLPGADDNYDILTSSDIGGETSAETRGRFIRPADAETGVAKGARETAGGEKTAGQMNRPLVSPGGLAVAVDIGTTTLVVKLIDIASGRELRALAALNPQRTYGADVISRINVSMDDASALSGLITHQIDSMIKTALSDSASDARDVRRIVVAGNTTMSYLLLGLPCRSLGLAPFKPAFIFKEEYTYDEIFHSGDPIAPVYVMPFVSAYVGGDITSGLAMLERYARGAATSSGDDITSGRTILKRYARDAVTSSGGDAPGRTARARLIRNEETSIGSDDSATGLTARENLASCSDTLDPSVADEPYILVDMGTNGEIAYRRGDRLLCTSTAAGPAFEGGNISCGSGSVEGAISKVWIRDGVIGYETIGGAPARSICGSGLLDAMACFVNEGIINGSGAMNADSPFVTEGRVVIAAGPTLADDEVSLTQRDVREFQLAKSAVRSGIETLIGEFGDLVPDRLYLAGGFGQRLDADSAFVTGLLPKSMQGRVVPVGNSSIAGAALAASDTDILKSAYRIASRGEEINLASHPKFNTLFMEYMTF